MVQTIKQYCRKRRFWNKLFIKDGDEYFGDQKKKKKNQLKKI